MPALRPSVQLAAGWLMPGTFVLGAAQGSLRVDTTQGKGTGGPGSAMALGSGCLVTAAGPLEQVGHRCESGRWGCSLLVQQM